MIQITKKIFLYLSVLSISCVIHKDINRNSLIDKQKTVKSYFDNGKIEYQYEFYNDLMHGLAIYYYENGNIKSEAKYENGKLHNKYKEYFSNGNIKFTIEYNNGYKHGFERWYYLNGQIKSEKQYNNNELIGVIVRWDSKGNIIY